MFSVMYVVGGMIITIGILLAVAVDNTYERGNH